MFHQAHNKNDISNFHYTVSYKIVFIIFFISNILVFALKTTLAKLSGDCFEQFNPLFLERWQWYLQQVSRMINLSPVEPSGELMEELPYTVRQLNLKNQGHPKHAHIRGFFMVK